MISILALVFLTVLLGLLVTRVIGFCAPSDIARVEAWLSDGSTIDQYRPMEKLLDSSDFVYLAQQPGFTPARIRALRAQRRNIFRSYLAEIKADFGALCFLIRALMVQSTVDRPDLARALFRVRTAFFWNLLRVECRLAAHSLGVSSAAVDIHGLIEALDSLSAQARTLQITANPSLA